MKLFGKVILTLGAFIIIGSAVSAAAYYMAPPAYYYPPQAYYAPNYPVFVPQPYGNVRERMTHYFGELPAPVPAPSAYYHAPYPMVPHVQYGIRTYTVYGSTMDEVSYVPYIRRPFLYRNTYMPAQRPGPVILPTYWRQIHNWW